MAPLLDSDETSLGGTARTTADRSSGNPRFVIIGAGSRGTAYAAAIVRSGLGSVAAVVEPVGFKREQFCTNYIWSTDSRPSPEQQFEDWKDFVAFEEQRQKDITAGIETSPRVDGVFVCVRDELHFPIVQALAPLGLHIMCEKPLATTLLDCLSIQRCLQRYPQRIFAIGHVLRYSPHNMLLRHLLLEQRVIGDILSIEHVEPVGWWHFSHSYVRGQWRKEKSSAPSLLTKSCHDIDFLLWLLCSTDGADKPAHLPARVASMGSLKQFNRGRKPKEAGSATNCLSCPIQDGCMYSAKRTYYERHLAKGNAKWPVEIVNPEVENILKTEGPEKAKRALMATLSEDYDARNTPAADIENRPWFGRCVWESDNDVCDDQTVTIEWDETAKDGSGIGAKTASFHMIAQTLSQCERRGRVYGTEGEISYDSKSITVNSFPTDTTRTHHPEVPKNSHHGGGDDGLTQQYVKAVTAVMAGTMDVQQAQMEFMGCSLDDAVRSHMAVFAAEEARREKKVVEWDEWWQRSVVARGV